MTFGTQLLIVVVTAMVIGTYRTWRKRCKRCGSWESPELVFSSGDKLNPHQGVQEPLLVCKSCKLVTPLK